MDQSVFTNVEIPAARVAMPLVRLTSHEVVLEVAIVDEIGEFLFAMTHDFIVNAFLRGAQRTKLSRVVMNDADRAVETQLPHSPSNHERIFRIEDRTAQDGVDVDIEFSIFGKPAKFLIQHFQTL